jgi:flagellar FliL protein
MASVADAGTEAAGAESGPEADGAGAKPKRSKKKLLMMAGGGVVLLGLLGGGYMYMSPGKSAAKTEAVKLKPVFIDLPDMLVNLMGPSDHPHYLRLKIALEVSDPRLVEQIKPLMPRVLDAFQTHLRELRASDLQGSAGLVRLRIGLLRRVNQAIYPAKVDAVLFKDMLIQ